MKIVNIYSHNQKFLFRGPSYNYLNSPFGASAAAAAPPPDAATAPPVGTEASFSRPLKREFPRELNISTFWGKLVQSIKKFK